MSTKEICGQVTKQSQLGISWNSRYLAVTENAIKIYKTESEYRKNGRCKYSFNATNVTIKKISEQKNEIKVEISTDPKKKYRLQIPNDLWALLDAYYANIHNTDSTGTAADTTDTTDPADTVHTDNTNVEPKKEIDDVPALTTEPAQVDTLNANEEHKTEDTPTNNEEITESNEVLICVDSPKENVLNDSPKLECESETRHEWNERYRSILDTKDDATSKSENMKALLSEFYAICSQHCVDIIEKSMNVGLDGLQNTFVRDEIEFKIITSDDEYHEIKSLITNSKQYEQAFDGAVPRLYYPLCCITEHMCYRIYCKVPLSSMTEQNLIFGKSLLDDAFKYNETISGLLNQAAQKLNLANHMCKYDESMQISTTSNIRVYETESDVYYVDNISELYPIDIVHFIKTVRKLDAKPSAFNTVLHPTLIAQNPEPISSDAFVPPNDDAQDENVAKAIYNLHSNIIPKFMENINHLKLKILGCDELKQLMIARGISMIYIGEVYNLCTVRYAKEIIGVFMIAQTIKDEMKKEFITSKDEYDEKLRYYINIFTNDDDSYTIELGVKEKIISLTNFKYGTCLNTGNVNKCPFKFVQYELERILQWNGVHMISVSDAYIKDILPSTAAVVSDHGDNLVSIQKQWLQVEASKSSVTDCETFEAFRGSSLSLMNKIDLLFPFHALKFEIMKTMVAVYSNMTQQTEEKTESMVGYCASLYSDCHDLGTFLFGSNHRQTLLMQIQLIKWLYSNEKEMESIDTLEALLQSIRAVFGTHSLHLVIIWRVLSEKYFETRNYGKAIECAKENILVLDEKRKYDDEYIAAHLRVSVIAEKIADHALAIRILNKLYTHLKKAMERDTNDKRKLSENMDIKMLSLSISRIKLNMCTMQKRNVLQKKWRELDHDESTMQECNKCKELIIQNLCLNPIKKSNDLLKDNANTFHVVCWINIIKEFEVNFLKLNQ